MNNTYTILPFRFARFNEEEYLLSNDVGEYIFLKNDEFHKFVNGELDPTSDLFYDIESKQIATTDKVEDVVKMLATNSAQRRVSWKISLLCTWLCQLCAAIQVVSIVR